MSVVSILARVVVGVVLVCAGVSKLISGPGWTKQAADMDVPRAVAIVVPYVEIFVGALLALGLFAPWPAIAAVALLVSFTIVIVRRIRDGSRSPCGCFGIRSTRPLGAYHVIRNLALIAVAVVALAWS